MKYLGSNKFALNRGFCFPQLFFFYGGIINNMTSSTCENCKEEFTDNMNKGIISNRGMCELCFIKWTYERNKRYDAKYKTYKIVVAKKPLKA